MNTNERQKGIDNIKNINELIKRLKGIKNEIKSDLSLSEQEIYQIYTDGFKKTIEPIKGDWFILQSQNKYYQFLSYYTSGVIISRHGETFAIAELDFERDYVKVTKEDVARHLRYLDSKGIKHIVYIPDMDKTVSISKMPDFTNNSDSYIPHSPYRQLNNLVHIHECDFYMITVGDENRAGSNGTKKRHTTYKEAEREAIRLCEHTNLEAFIVGVVASVKPVKTEKVITTYTPKVIKR